MTILTQREAVGITALSEPEVNELEYFFCRAEYFIDQRRYAARELKAVYDEANAAGFDPKRMKDALNLRAMSTEDRQEHEALVTLYAQEAGLEL